MSAILARLREPSSFAGLSVILALFGVNVAPEAWSALVQFVSAGAALVAFFLPERR